MKRSTRLQFQLAEWNDDTGWDFGHRTQLTARQIRRITGWLTNAFMNRSVCSGCGNVLRVEVAWARRRCHKSYAYDSSGFGAAVYPGDSELKFCAWCSYWQWYAYYNTTGGEHFGPNYANAAAAITQLRSFDPATPPECASELAMMLRRRDNTIHQLPPARLETLVADVFKANYSPCEVMHVGRSHDGGKDVVMVTRDGEPWLIEVKTRRSTKKGESVRTLRHLLGALVVHKAMYGAIVSAADHFTSAAFAERDTALENFGFRVELVDKGRLLRLLGALLPRQPWNAAIRATFGVDGWRHLRRFSRLTYAGGFGDLLRSHARRSKRQLSLFA